ncbi:hypothetical protein C7399_12070 [Paraburkholderia tropica]|uniref:Uncharacterized protein n=1 Tax=Paraburkholderia tropica TaxID=92647 RepID=A0ABX5MHF5_9BURK|nr:hypothetical protein [Paraburkholderia tropica]PXX10801.1 hypothetical protein C7400_12070 [Paraburkholderia tropica]PZW75769.1 hypothetical protein C7399_12070 [Paraburkholderia tropica]
MTPQKLLTWFGEFAKANPTFVASVSILTLGGIPLLGGAMLLTWSVWLGWRIYAPGPVPPVTAQPAAATASAAAHDPSSGDWLTLAIHRLSSFNPLYCVAAIAAVAIAIYILTRWFKEIKTLFQRLVSDQEMRLRNAKIFTTALFGFAMVLPVLFLWAIVVNGKTELQTYVAVAGCVMLAMLNWLSFAAHRTTVRLLTMAGALFFCVAFVPLLMQNPTFYPQMVVRMLGLGNIYASSVTLSSQQCATLRPYGVDCEAKKDESITMTNVNILNRLGNSVLMELMVDDTQVCGLEGRPHVRFDSSLAQRSRQYRNRDESPDERVAQRRRSCSRQAFRIGDATDSKHEGIANEDSRRPKYLRGS